MNNQRVIAYLATSVDGFIAGRDDDLEWLSEPRGSGVAFAADAWAERAATGLGFDDFLAGVGCLLMGRRTYDAVRGMGGPWPYGDLPIHVATTRPLDSSSDDDGVEGTGDGDGGGNDEGADATRPPAGAVTAVHGGIGHLVAEGLARARGKSLYVDGGTVVRAALAAGVLDELIVTIIPTVLGEGISLFDSSVPRTELTVADVGKYGDGLVQVHYRCR